MLVFSVMTLQQLPQGRPASVMDQMLPFSEALRKTLKKVIDFLHPGVQLGTSEGHICHNYQVKIVKRRLIATA